MEKYLYLFYGNYLDVEKINPYSIINSAKADIKRVGADRLTRTRGALRSQKAGFEQDIKKLYGYKPEDFKMALNNTPIMQVLDDYDAAQKMLEEALNELHDLEIAKNEMNRLLADIDIILVQGAALGGLAAGSIEKAVSYAKKIEALMNSINNGSAGDKDNDDITAAGTVALNSLSGSLFEIALPIAWLSATGQVLDKATSVMMAVGHVSSNNVTAKSLPDHQMEAARQKIEQTFASLGSDSKADNVMISRNSATGTIDITSFQAKNYKDISSIGITSEKTYKQLNIGGYFDWKFLVNTAGGLADTHLQQAFVSFSRFRDITTRVNAWQIDNVWANIKRQMQVLCAADTIAAKGASELGRGLDYYVIRNRYEGDVQIISVDEIFTKLISAYNSGTEFNSMGIKNSWISARENSNDKGSRMRNYGEINAKSFVSPPYYPDWESSKQRSSSAYDKVYTAVCDTKVSISLNFKDFF